MEIVLPSQLNALALGTLYSKAVTQDGSPASIRVIINFANLHFIEPTGITALSNLCEWLLKFSVRIDFSGLDNYSPAMSFLDDAGFFRQYLGNPLNENATLRPSTSPLRRLHHADSNMWLRGEFFRWVAHQSKHNINSFDLLRAVLMEVFHNIQNHSTVEIGSTFAQYFPANNRLRMSVSDFGVGIPYNVRRNLTLPYDQLADCEAIKKACEFGFTTGSTLGNAGRGLPNLIDAVAGNYNGIVRIISYKGFLQLSKRSINKFIQERSWIYPGCMIDLKIDLNNIPNSNDNREEFQWL